MSEKNSFDSEVRDNISQMMRDEKFKQISHAWLLEAIRCRYDYNFSWLGRPIIHIPQDTHITQELVWAVRPDLIIETGIAHGGSLILSASMLSLLDYCDAALAGESINPRESRRKVVGLDVDIRAHNRTAIESHPMSHMIHMIEGSSVDTHVVDEVRKFAEGYKNVMVFLDSNHIHEHVLSELRAYAPLVAMGSYCVVWDSGVDDLPEGFITDRPWGKGNNPKTALLEYLEELKASKVTACDGEYLNFEIDDVIESKIMISSASSGFLRRF